MPAALETAEALALDDERRLPGLELHLVVFTLVQEDRFAWADPSGGLSI